MDFDQLEIFLEVARLSSFSRAAEKRFRTQPVISSHVDFFCLTMVIDHSIR